ncbi:hypothetical protein [Microbispora sp. H10670]|uniref:hypothetical protein n=1 Tax=Microbispora sp. H10670 TaxID=2729108 RepID=UPI0016019B55|nr:hypothetical protein [Microbispora sp. H10670]
MTGHEASRVLLDKIDAREAALAGEAEQTRAHIAELTARLRELDEAIGHLRITRKTLLSLADVDDAEPAAPPCQALDLPIVSKNTENIRSKLKRLVSRGILRSRARKGRPVSAKTVRICW